MRGSGIWVGILWGIGLALPALAAGAPVAQATVETVQMPAWLERGGQSQPLAVGMALRNGDRIRTGADARAVVRLAEGSTLRLGEQTELGLHSRSLKPSRQFKGALDLRGGAFHLVTRELRRAAAQREIDVRVGAVTAAVRDADLFARSEAGHHQLLLAGGRAEIRRAGEIFEAAEPATLFSVTGSAAQEVGTADAAQTAQWSQATALVAGHGVAQPGGQWQVLVARADSQREALVAYDAARAAGYDARVRVRAASSGDATARWRYEVVLAQLASEAEAAALGRKIQQQLGFAASADK